MNFDLAHMWPSQDADAEEKDKDDEQINRGYHECVEEIKNEGKILGSLQLHQEAIRRLKQKQGAEDEIIRRRSNPARRRFQRSFAASMQNQLSQSLLLVSNPFTAKRSSSSENSMDPSARVMLGRRESAMREGFDQFDPATFVAQHLGDIELSDSDWEDEDEQPSVGQIMGDHESALSEANQSNGTKSSRRSSLVGRRGSFRPTLSRKRSSLVKVPSAIRRRSSRRSSASSMSNGSNQSSQKSKDDGKMPSSGEHKSDGEEGKRETTTPIDEGAEIVAGIVAAFERQKSGNETKDSGCGAIEDGITSGDVLPQPIFRMTPRRPSRFNRHNGGRRRSSLFSVDERRESIVERSSGTPGESLENSLTGSLQGSFTSSLQGSFTNSLKGSFVDRQSSMDSIGAYDGESLICGWGRKGSDLTSSGQSEVLSIQEELLTNGNGNRNGNGNGNGNVTDLHKSNSTLICGWDPSQSSTSIELHDLNNGDSYKLTEKKSGGKEQHLSDLEYSNRTLLCDWTRRNSSFSQEDNEKVLLQAKEEFESLFNVRNNEVV